MSKNDQQYESLYEYDINEDELQFQQEIKDIKTKNKSFIPTLMALILSIFCYSIALMGTFVVGTAGLGSDDFVYIGGFFMVAFILESLIKKNIDYHRGPIQFLRGLGVGLVSFFGVCTILDLLVGDTYLYGITEYMAKAITITFWIITILGKRKYKSKNLEKR